MAFKVDEGCNSKPPPLLRLPSKLEDREGGKLKNKKKDKFRSRTRRTCDIRCPPCPAAAHAYFKKTKENLIYLITSSRNGPRCYIFPLFSYLFEISRVCAHLFLFFWRHTSCSEVKRYVAYTWNWAAPGQYTNDCLSIGTYIVCVCSIIPPSQDREIQKNSTYLLRCFPFSSVGERKTFPISFFFFLSSPTPLAQPFSSPNPMATKVELSNGAVINAVCQDQSGWIFVFLYRGSFFFLFPFVGGYCSLGLFGKEKENCGRCWASIQLLKRFLFLSGAPGDNRSRPHDVLTSIRCHSLITSLLSHWPISIGFIAATELQVGGCACSRQNSKASSWRNRLHEVASICNMRPSASCRNPSPYGGFVTSDSITGSSSWTGILF